MGLSEQLASHLNRVVPDDVALAALPGGSIRIMAGAETSGWVEVQWWWPQEPAESFARNVLASLQDEIIENSLHTGWPPVDPLQPTSPQRGSELPAPDAKVVDGKLVWWYGDPDSPALALPSITLDAE